MGYRATNVLGIRRAAGVDRAILLVGHGRSGEDRSDLIAPAVAGQLRRCYGFQRVEHACVGAPANFSAVLEGIDARAITVIPMFAADGFFVRRIVADLVPAFRAAWPDRQIRVTAALGTHPPFIAALARQVRELADSAHIRRATAGLLAIGHGSRFGGSQDAAAALAWTLRGGFGASVAAYLMQPPLAQTWTSLLDTREVIAVPVFFGNGRHVRVDVPRCLGLDAPPCAGEFSGPWVIGGRRLWCARAWPTPDSLARTLADLARHDSTEATVPAALACN